MSLFFVEVSDRERMFGRQRDPSPCNRKSRNLHCRFLVSLDKGWTRLPSSPLLPHIKKEGEAILRRVLTKRGEQNVEHRQRGLLKLTKLQWDGRAHRRDFQPRNLLCNFECTVCSHVICTLHRPFYSENNGSCYLESATHL